MISGSKTYLRPALLSDANTILKWENDPELWRFTETAGPFTQSDIVHFIQESNNLWQNGQLRLIIVEKESETTLGALDLFEFSAHRKKAGLGILIGDKNKRQKGFAHDALIALVRTGLSDMKIETLECIIYPDNVPSIRLFERCGFKPVGLEFFKDNRVIRYRYTASL
jgi:diamine N-acetyltransferase